MTIGGCITDQVNLNLNIILRSSYKELMNVEVG